MSRFLQLVEEARARIRETTVAEIHRRVEEGDRFYLIDVREQSEWGRGHIPGANWLGKGVIERDIERAIPEAGEEIVLYCGGGQRSVLAADALQRMGSSNVSSMAGGIGGWLQAGLPLDRA
jgi:rhodanese-related sulfurtransferase